MWGIDPLNRDEDSPHFEQENTAYVMSALKFSIKPANRSIISRLGPLHSHIFIFHTQGVTESTLALGVSRHTLFFRALFKKYFFPF